VQAAGGSIRRAPEDIPGIGRFSVVTDPHGAAFVLFKGNSTPPPVAAPGTPGFVGWNELHAGDLATEWPFYEKLFCWSNAGEVDMGPAGAYRMFATGTDPSAVGGMMTKTPETPNPFWLYYFNVAAVDATVARVQASGGKLLMGPHQVPGGQWIAQFLDPQGAIFGVVSVVR
jgi:predicted enzyme related to lactoylglutathione lyase